MIPKIIHQMWLAKGLDPNLPQKYQYLRESFQYWNPDFEYKLWDMKTTLNLFLHHPVLQRFVKTFETIEPWICKCDFARYAVLYAYGGLYADLDYECLRPLGSLLENRSHLFVLDLNRDINLRHRVCNGIFAVAPNSPLLLFILEEIVKRQHWRSIWHPITPVVTVLFKTGPTAMYQDTQKFFKGQIPPDFFANSCLLIPIKTTLWAFILVYVFHMKPPPSVWHSNCLGVEAYTQCHQLSGTGWWSPQTKIIPKKGIPFSRK